MLRVTGQSLAPEYNEGDFVLIAKIPFLYNQLQNDDVIVFQHPTYGVMIKKIASIGQQGEEIFVIGVHDNSVDSRSFGSIKRADVLGKVVWHIRKPIGFH